MAFGSKTLTFFKILLVLITLVSIVGMIFISNYIFNPSSDNTITVSTIELVFGKIALGFYWSLCVITLVVGAYIKGSS